MSAYKYCIILIVSLFFLYSDGNNSTINIGMISCLSHGAISIRGVLGSLLRNPSKHLVNLKLIFDHEQDSKLMQWCNHSIIPVLSNKLYNVTVIQYEQHVYLKKLYHMVESKGHETRRFQCALLKLGMLELFPELDNILIIDTDTLILEDLSHLWALLNENMSNRTFGAALEYIGIPPAGWTYFGGKKHYYPYTGLNTGVLYYNLKRMRENNITAETLLDTNDEPSKLLDQDIINTWAYYHQDEIYELPCQWNKRRCQRCDEELYKNNTGILHGNGGAFLPRAKQVWMQMAYGYWEDIYTKFCSIWNYE